MLSVERITVRRGGRAVLDAVDMRVAPGEIHVLVGASGAGKTTLLRGIAGLEVPDRGRIRIGGTIVAEDGSNRVPPHERKVAMTFQEDALWPHMSVVQHLTFGLRNRLPGAERREVVTEMLARFGLEARRNERPGCFSGGERQRLGLARALAQRPRLLLLDEPLAHVDLMGQRELAATIVATVREYSMSALWVTHRPEEILPLADEASFLADGRSGPAMPAPEALQRLGSASLSDRGSTSDSRGWPGPAPLS